MKLSIKIDDQTFDVQVGDLDARPVVVLVDGAPVEVWPEDAAPVLSAQPAVTAHAARPAAALPARPAPAAQSSAAGSAVLAPIPGVILSLAVKEGDSVAIGQEICVLEAMKMKNLIRSNRAGTVRAVRSAVGDQVRRDQVLVEFTD